jgi:hypothetical protein
MYPNFTNATTIAPEEPEVLQSKQLQYMYLETSILGFLAVVGLLGNAQAMRVLIGAHARFARQITVSFLSLTLSDIVTCCVRIPLLMYNLLRPGWDNRDVVYEVWLATFAASMVTIWINLLLGVQRLLITYSYPWYRKYFTLRRTLIIISVILIKQLVVYIAFKLASGSKIYMRYSPLCNTDQCHVEDGYHLVIFSTKTAINGLFPLILTLVAYSMITCKIVTAGFLKLDRIDERNSYHRVTYIAACRALLLVLCWLPLLLFYVAGPYFAELPPLAERILEYQFCVESVISPFITLSDSDFRYPMRRQKCIRRRRALQRGSTIRGRRDVTSAAMRTLGQSE